MCVAGRRSLKGLGVSVAKLCRHSSCAALWLWFAAPWKIFALSWEKQCVQAEAFVEHEDCACLSKVSTCPFTCQCLDELHLQ